MPKNLSQDVVSTIKKHSITCSDTNIILKNQILYFEENTSQDSPTKTFAKQIKACLVGAPKRCDTYVSNNWGLDKGEN